MDPLPELPPIFERLELPNQPVQEINIDPDQDDIADDDFEADDSYGEEALLFFEKTNYMLDTPQILIAEDQPIAMKVLKEQFTTL